MSYDYVLVGGGLQNGLIALALRQWQPAARVALLERADQLGGNHTWSFHHGDVPTEALALVDPLVAYRWPAYEVRFPGMVRRMDLPYNAVPSDRFDTVVRVALDRPGCALQMGAEVCSLDSGGATLVDGSRVEGRQVIDGRGPGAMPASAGCGFQKFLGLEVEVDRPLSADALPVLMDATNPQVDGFQFLYVLPFTPRRWLVEDTAFADGPDLDRSAALARIHGHLARLGRKALRIVREESGLLPMPWSAGPQFPIGWPLRVGYVGGWYHPATGYSFPVAVRLALTVGRQQPGRILPAVRRLWRQHRRQAAFARFLNFLLFRCIDPAERWQIFRRFYRILPAAAIRRFYGLQIGLADAARLLVGRPPTGFSLRRAFARPEVRSCST